MTSDDIQTLLTGEFSQTVNKFKAFSTGDQSAIDKYIKQYDPAKHDIMDTSIRRDDRLDDGTVVPVARIALAYQKLIVKIASFFLCGKPIKLESDAADQNQKDLLSVIQKMWDDNKMNYKNKQIVQLYKSETACAELWYYEDADPDYWNGTPFEGVRYRLRYRLLARSLGDDLHPVFGDNGDLLAFGRGYTVIKVDNSKEEHFDIYTADKIYVGIKGAQGWTSEPKDNPIKKIPVIYHSQPVPEWNDVQQMIDRLEVVLSNNADVNDYFSSPMLIIDGNIQKWIKKGQTNKLLQVAQGSKVDYLTWTTAPEAVKNEVDTLMRLIHSMSHTPDFSFEQMMNISGDAPSGTALEMLFLAARMKAQDSEENYGEGVQRRLNLFQAAAKAMSLKVEKVVLNVTPKFEIYLPNNDAEQIENIINAVQGGVLSKETGVSLNPQVKNPEAEIKLIEKDGLNNENNQ